MAKEITIPIFRNYYDTGNIYKKSSITLKSGFSVLVGCNGAGKTTMIHQLKNFCENNKYKIIYYNNLIDGGNNMMDKLLNVTGDTEGLALRAFSSEGENIYYNMGDIFGMIGSSIRNFKPKDGKNELFIFLDAFDSGASIDIIDEYKAVFKIVIDDAATKNIDLYIIAVANEYELAAEEDCIDVQSCEYIRFKDYEDYKKFVLKTRKNKNKRLGLEE